MLRAMLFTGCMFGLSRSRTVMSASLPGAISSHSSRPIARVPPTQAISSVLSALPAAASIFFSFCSAETRYISRNMSSALLLPAPSVPMASGTPAAANASTGATPLASLRLEPGQVTAYSFFSAMRAMSASSIQTQWNAPPP